MRLFVNKHFRSGWSFLPRWFLILGIWMRRGFSYISRLIGHLFVPLVDIAFLQLSLVLAISVRFGDLELWDYYRIVNLVYTAVWISCLYAVGLYRHRVSHISVVLEGILIGFLLNTSWTFFFKQYAFSRQVVFVAGLLNGLFLSLWRLVVRMVSEGYYVSFLEKLGFHVEKKRMLIVGSPRSGKQILSKLNGRVDSAYKIVGFLGLNEKDLLHSENDKIPILGTLKDLKRVALAHRVQEVIFSHEAMRYDQILHVIAEGKLLGLNFKMISRDVDVITGITTIENLDDVPLVDLDFRIYSGPNMFFKRTVDLFVVGLLLPILILVFLYVSIYSRYRFRRVMISDGRGQPLPVWQILKDKKLAVRWLQCVPLTLEVLKGNMSLVGTEIVPFQDNDFGRGFKPGLTGLVQVNEEKGLKEEERRKYNLYYLKNYSPFLDLRIILKTLFHI